MGQCGEYWGDGESGARGECRGAGDENSATVRERGVEPARGGGKAYRRWRGGSENDYQMSGGEAKRGSRAARKNFAQGNAGEVGRAASAGARGMKTAQQYAGGEVLSRRGARESLSPLARRE